MNFFTEDGDVDNVELKKYSSRPVNQPVHKTVLL